MHVAATYKGNSHMHMICASKFEPSLSKLLLTAYLKYALCYVTLDGKP